MELLQRFYYNFRPAILNIIDFTFIRNDLSFYYFFQLSKYEFDLLGLSDLKSASTTD